MTDNVWVPRELLEWMKEQLPNHVALDGETDLYRRAQLSRLLAQPVANEPVAWRIFDGEGGYDYTEDEETAEQWKARNGPKYANFLEPLSLHSPAPALPEGYALVPIEPTPEMIMAGIDNNSTSWNEDTDQGFPAQVANDVYRAMLSAALQPTEGSTANSHECIFNLDMEGKCFYCENTEGLADE